MPEAHEFLGTAFLLSILVGSGIMGSKLSAGNDAVALLMVSIATGAGLYVIISLLGPISGSHINPVVSLVSWSDGDLKVNQLFSYWFFQISGAISGVWFTHLMFDLPLFDFSTKPRAGFSQWISEFVGTLALLAMIKIALNQQKEGIPCFAALMVMSGILFTSSTFFCNPAVTVARCLTNTFTGIRPSDILGFLIAQLLATLVIITVSKKISAYTQSK